MRDAPANGSLENFHSNPFDGDFFKSSFRHGKAFKKIVQCHKKEVAIGNGFLKCNLQKMNCRSLTGPAVLYKWEVIKVLQEHVTLSSPKKDFICCSAHDSSLHAAEHKHTIIWPYFFSVYNAVRQDITMDGNKDMYYIDDHEGAPSSFSTFNQAFLSKTALSMKINSFVA